MRIIFCLLLACFWGQKTLLFLGLLEVCGFKGICSFITFLYVASNVLRAPVLSEDQLLPGISPHVGLIYSVSDKLFCYLEGYISYYRTIERLGSESAAVTSPGATTIRITQTWAGVGVGVGWRF